MHEVGVIAHSCGVKEARALERKHVYLIDNSGSPEPLTNRYPDKTPKPEYLIASTADETLGAENTDKKIPPLRSANE